MTGTPARLKSSLLLAIAAAAPLLVHASDEISLLRVLEPNAQAKSVAISPDGSTAAINTLSGMQFWDLTTGNILELIDEDVRACGFIQQSPDGRLLVLGCRDSSLLFDFAAREVLAEIDTPRIGHAAFDRAQKRLATLFLDSHNSYPPPERKAHFAVFDIEDLSEPSWLGSFWNTIFGYDELEPDESFSVPEPEGWRSFTQLQFGSTPDRLVASTDSTVFYFSFDGEKQEQHPRTMAKEAPYLCGGQNSGVVDPVAMRGTVEEIETRYVGRETRSRYRNHPICRFSSDMKEAVFAYGGQLGAWDIARARERWHYEGRPDAHHIDITPDGSVIALASEYHELAMLDAVGNTLATGRIDGSAMARVMDRYKRCDDHFQRLSVSADGRTLLFNECAVFVLRRQ